MASQNRTIRLIANIVLAAGIIILAYAIWLHRKSPRPIDEDIYASKVLWAALSVISAGLGLRFVPMPWGVVAALIFAIALPYVVIWIAGIIVISLIIAAPVGILGVPLLVILTLTQGKRRKGKPEVIDQGDQRIS